MAGGEAGNAMGKLCTNRTTKIVWVDRSAEPFVVYWDRVWQKIMEKEHV